ncbi:hypothetical protein B0J18DRAFT_491498 [Chaetomium sp. MPI-SDFR-AT-0129]|uniref:Methyltransferase n=1 Tax=Dichotomopilus funicola TaxID=1934379 RepID=A0AAN6V3C8_9PEZI|nr:hypothetical protein B0J18DRAFT_491498 [Chaetomium sp. MPI-SDFR-AT-0129]KAK4144057.1 hypothetical protein C8A04DRAFT_28172 [Dichotomopilus funicola]
MAITHIPPRGDVVTDLNFYSPPADGSAPWNLAGDVPPGVTPRNYGQEAHQVVIHDARGQEKNFTLDHDAFQILTNQPPSAEKDFTDDESIKKNYYPEVEKLLLDAVPGANKVIIFDHTIRRPNSTRGPVPRVHIDQTAHSTANRVRRHAASESEAEDLLSNSRYRIINVWRPLNASPIESSPLAYASSATLLDTDVIPVEHRYPASAGGYVGQTAAIRHNEGQKWYYLSGMTGAERILLECFDSDSLKEDNVKVKGGRVPHTAFEDPRTREGAEPRESIEVRALVFGA